MAKSSEIKNTHHSVPECPPLGIYLIDSLAKFAEMVVPVQSWWKRQNKLCGHHQGDDKNRAWNTWAHKLRIVFVFFFFFICKQFGKKKIKRRIFRELPFGAAG